MASSQPSQGCSQEREKEPMKNSAGIKQKHIFPCAVIEFNLNNVIYVSACPMDWISGDSCVWPPKTAIERKAIMTNMTPESDWLNIEDITVLGIYKVNETESNSSNEDTYEGASGTQSQRIINTNRAEVDVSETGNINGMWNKTANSREEYQQQQIAALIQPSTTGSNNITVYERIVNDAEILLEQKTNDDIWNVMVSIEEQLKLLTERLGNLETLYVNNPRNIGTTQNLPKLPLTTLAELQQLEEDLQRKADLQENLLNYLQFIGGNDYKTCVFRVCEKVFTNYVAQFCSWTGKGGNLQLANLKLLDILK
ncbi:hypothetical protein NQ315_003675, partial [Exocentrus adspersus]